MNKKINGSKMTMKAGSGVKRPIGAVMLIVALLTAFTGCTGNQTLRSGLAKETEKMELTKADSMKEAEQEKETSQKKGTEQAVLPAEKKMALDFTLPDVMGNTRTLSDESGKKVYIKFWATWCSICLGGLEELEELGRDLSKEGNTVLLTIVSPGTKGEMSREDFAAWYKKQGYEFPVLLDDGGEIARRFGVRGYPTSVLVNSQGTVEKTIPGHLSKGMIENMLADLQ